MRAAVSSPPPRCCSRRRATVLDARHVFGHMPQRSRPPQAAGFRAPPASAATRTLPRRSAVSAAACRAASVPYLFRTLLPIPTAFCSIPRVRLIPSAFVPSRRNFEGYIPHSCSGSSLQIYSRSSLLSLSPSSALVVSSQLTSSDVAQRSEEWFSLRKDKLTTSTFGTALGFWGGNRRSELWNEKVFGPTEIKLADAARSAMDWGTLHESIAIEQYTSMTGRLVGYLGFAVHTEANSGWLGASPDGVLGCDPDGGILEVKCPFNKGKPELALPWRAMPYYYMPQVQGLMEIMGRDWVDLYCWTPNGSSLFRVPRDRTYWELIHNVLHDFWWGNVMPARELVLLGKEAEASSFKPQPKHRLTNLVIVKSRKLATEARLLCMDVGGQHLSTAIQKYIQILDKQIPACFLVDHDFSTHKKLISKKRSILDSAELLFTDSPASHTVDLSPLPDVTSMKIFRGSPKTPFPSHKLDKYHFSPSIHKYNLDENDGSI